MGWVGSDVADCVSFHHGQAFQSGFFCSAFFLPVCCNISMFAAYNELSNERIAPNLGMKSFLSHVLAGLHEQPFAGKLKNSILSFLPSASLYCILLSYFLIIPFEKKKHQSNPQAPRNRMAFRVY